VVGVDQAGRGAWAGPLVAAAVCLKVGKKFSHPLLRDSKKLSQLQREKVFDYIKTVCEIGLGIVTVEEIDEWGLQKANVMVIERAVVGTGRDLSLRGIELVIDHIGAFKKYTTLTLPYSLHKFGEAKFKEIAAASIAAKVYRDDLMKKLAQEYPGYGFERHKGYGTALHQVGLKRLGVMSAHRLSFRPIKVLLAND